MRLSGVVARVMREAYPGPQPTFSELHVVKALLVLKARGVVGRKTLSDELGLGPGAVRTLIHRLSSEGLISTAPPGCSLTKKGHAFSASVNRRIRLTPVDAGKLGAGRRSVAVLVRAAAEEVGKGLEQRDAAVRAGASGATTLLFKQGKLRIPDGSENCEKDYPDPVWARLKRLLRPEDGDIIIVCGADSLKRAEYGALASALTFIRL